MKLGEYNDLVIGRESKIGLFLKDDEGNEVLLPNRYTPEKFTIGDPLRVFLYNDSEGRLIATTLEPKAVVNSFAFLECKESTSIGAFMDLGIMKDLLVPKKNQLKPMEAGRSYLIWVYVDKTTDRLVGTSNFEHLLSDRPEDIFVNDAVRVRVWTKNELGWRVVVNDEYIGMLYNNQIFQPIEAGMELTAYVNQIREDGKLDLLLQKPGAANLDDVSRFVLDALKEEGGFLPLHDNSNPEKIKQRLQMSKKSFKRAVGILFKQRQIDLVDGGIRLRRKL